MTTVRRDVELKPQPTSLGLLATILPVAKLNLSLPNVGQGKSPNSGTKVTRR